jgi:hypothetical protein
MKHKLNPNLSTGELAVVAVMSPAHVNGIEDFPDVPLHPLDGPVPTDCPGMVLRHFNRRPRRQWPHATTSVRFM